MARQFTAYRLPSSKSIVVVGVTAADKCLFTPFTTPTLVRYNGALAFQVGERYAEQVREIVRRFNAFVPAQAPVATTTRRPASDSRRRTSSGWCRDCEDGAINLCRFGGCY